MTEVFKLSEVTRYIAQVFEINFEDAFWISCEIHQINESRGHYYITLVEKSDKDDRIAATLDARLWRAKAGFIRQKTKSEIHTLFYPGLEVKIKGTLGYHDVYGLAFHITDVDTDYALGAMERRRRKTHAELTAAGTYKLNKQYTLPDRIYKLAVLTSRRAAGWADFMAELTDNDMGIPYHVDLYHCAVQGQNALPQLTSALRMIHQSDIEYDLICLLRGGGSRLDLHVFDDAELCYAISKMDIPVYTAIGHEIDQSLADLTAHTHFKTPTAMAASINDHMMVTLSELASHQRAIYDVGQRQIHRSLEQTRRLSDHLQYATQRRTIQLHQVVRNQSAQLQNSASQSLTHMRHTLKLQSKWLEVVDPDQTLRRGYALVSQEGHIVMRGTDVDDNKGVHITFHDKTIYRT